MTTPLPAPAPSRLAPAAAAAALVAILAACHAPARSTSPASSAPKPRLAIAIPTPDPRLVTTWGGVAAGLAVDDRHAYFGHGDRLAVAAIRRFARPALVAESRPLGGEILDVRRADRVAAVRLADAVQLVDIRRPRHPMPGARITWPAPVLDIEADGGTILVLTQGGRLTVVAGADPAAPRAVADVAGLTDARDLAVLDHRAYVVGAALDVIDLRRPDRPTRVGHAPVEGFRIDVAGERAYVQSNARVDHGVELRVVDIRPGSGLAVVAEDRADWSVDAVARAGRWYRAMRGATRPAREVAVTDLRGGGAPADRPPIAVSMGAPNALEVTRDRLVVLSSYDGLRVVDLGAWGGAQEVGAVEVPGHVADVARAGDTAWVLAGSAPGGWARAQSRALAAIDVTTPTAPLPRGRLALDPTAHRLALADGHAFVIDQLSLAVVDVARADAPRRVGALRLLSERWDGNVAHTIALAVHDRRAFVLAAFHVGTTGGGVLEVDVANPARPALVGQLRFAHAPTAFALSGDRLVVVRDLVPGGAGRTALMIATHTDGATGGWTVSNELVLAGTPLDVVATADRAIVVTDAGLRMVDLSTPTRPRLTASAPLSDARCTGPSTLLGDRLYLSCERPSDPFRGPVESDSDLLWPFGLASDGSVIPRSPVTGNAGPVAPVGPDGSTILVAGGDLGLAIIQPPD